MFSLGKKIYYWGLVFMQEIAVTIINKLGLHARPAAALVQSVAKCFYNIYTLLLYVQHCTSYNYRTVL